MLRILFLISSILMTSTGLTVAGYTVGSRSRDYNSGSYSTSGGFVGLSSSSASSPGSPSSSSLISKDTHADLTDQLTSSGNYGGATSHRYSTSSGAHSSGASDDNTQSSGYGSHSTSNNDNINSITGTYTNDIYTSTDINPYSGSSDNSYASGSHGSPSLTNYASHSIGSDHNSIDYGSYGSSSSSSANSYGPKTAYNSKHHPHSHGSPYGIASALKFMSNPHPNYPSTNHLNSYSGHIGSYSGGRHGGPGSLGGIGAHGGPGLGGPGTLSSHGSHGSHGLGGPGGPGLSSLGGPGGHATLGGPGGSGLNYPGSGHSYNEGPRYSGSSLSFLSGHGSAPGNFMHGAGPSSSVHRNIPSFLLGAASSVNPTFVKGPSSFYSGAFGPKSGSKYIIIKDGGGVGPSHLMHPETGGGYSSGMFAGAGGYKVRSAGPYSAGSTGHFAAGNYPSHAGHVSSSGFSGSTGHHHAPAGASTATGSFFGFK
ncbi:keratin, type I cytoskeletal 9-like isoform X2 [Microplitis mediator]|uniref:keratin, type I cytoskeletal 9-like isoform X2 n=1 Tax=Microplitis mediator TaxID=375433 RepID=UPI002553264C|nr:keratin, type I cytoskeletal 9-like isoform X2 [Microplitis mediator]